MNQSKCSSLKNRHAVKHWVIPVTCTLCRVCWKEYQSENYRVRIINWYFDRLEMPNSNQSEGKGWRNDLVKNFYFSVVSHFQDSSFELVSPIKQSSPQLSTCLFPICIKSLWLSHLTFGPWVWESASFHRWCRLTCLGSPPWLSRWCCTPLTNNEMFSQSPSQEQEQMSPAVNVER